MANIRVFRSLNVDELRVSPEDVTRLTSTLIRQDDGVERVDYRGRFSFSGPEFDPIVHGVVDEIEYFRFGVKFVEVTNINRDANRIASFVDNFDTIGFLKFLYSGNDIARLSPGNDKARGFAGADRVLAGRGDDTVIGGTGDDTLIGEGGSDRLEGSGGRDVLSGRTGSDALFGGSSNDRLNGQGGGDSLFGGGGRDRLDGGGGKDRLSGGGGDDLLIGGGRGDLLKGGGGDDTLQGGAGLDTLTGGRGEDHFRFTDRDSTNLIRDFRQGADHIEILSGASRFRQLDLDQAGDDVFIGFANTRIRVQNSDVDQFDAGDFIFS